MLTERLLTGDTNATFIQIYHIYIGIYTFANFNKVLMQMIINVFPTYAFREQKRCLSRHPIKPFRSMKLCTFISRLQELDVYLWKKSSGTQGQ